MCCIHRLYVNLPSVINTNYCYCLYSKTPTKPDTLYIRIPSIPKMAFKL